MYSRAMFRWCSSILFDSGFRSMDSDCLLQEGFSPDEVMILSRWLRAAERDKDDFRYKIWDSEQTEIIE